MAIVKSEIISFWNQSRKGGLSDTSEVLDEAIQVCLDDLSNSNFLKASDTDQTLDNTSLTLDYPTLYKSLMDGGIILNDGSVDLQPLTKISWRDYKNMMRSFNSGMRSIPSVYAVNDEKFYLYNPPGQDYTTEIWYWKYHAKDVDAIEFSDEFRNAIKYGTVFFKSMLQGNMKYAQIWGPMFANEKKMRRLTQNTQPGIVKG